MRLRKIKQRQAKLSREVLKNTAKLVRDDARANAPKDSGDLAKSYKTKAGKRSRKGQSYSVISENPVAHLQEFGTVKRSQSSGKSVGKVTGSHTLENALNKHERKLRKDMKRAMRKLR